METQAGGIGCSVPTVKVYLSRVASLTPNIFTHLAALKIKPELCVISYLVNTVSVSLKASILREESVFF